ncbi:MAG: LytTR family transcriptional regulator DNA-binding domain-containing protein, partial [Crocinitomicaceae bacterium]|nr:LytTR family transcriptional regulator DNA-binding domain-containing protein [Crocinitomicaceae bacterium]
LLPNKSVTQVYLDKEGNTWVSTISNGIFFYSKKYVEILPPVEENDLRVNQMYNDVNGKLYISYFNGNITSLDGVENYRSHYHSLTGAPAFVAYDHLTGEVSDYTDFNVSFRGQKHRFFSRAILWSGDSMFVTGIGPTKVLKLVNGKVKSVKEYLGQFTGLVEYNGKIYASSLSGLFCLENDKFQKLDIGSFSDVRINKLQVLDDYLVLGTSGKGIALLDRTNTIVRSINKEKGISSNFVSGLFSEGDSVLWITTNKGVSRFELGRNGRYSVKIIDKSDGLLSNLVWDVAVRNDTLWIGTSKGVNYMSLNHLYPIEEGEYSYYLKLNKCWVNGENSGFSKTQFGYNENEFKFNFSAVSLALRDDLVYRFRLNGVDKKWTYTRSLVAQYPFLPPGKYEFIVQTRGNNQAWEINEKSFSFVIHKAFWKTWWFLILVVFLIALLIYLFFRYRILSYNRDIIREIVRQVLKRIRKNEKYIIVRQAGQEVRINTAQIIFIKSSGNYLEIQTDQKKYVTRMKIGDFLNVVPDPIEFLRVHRSFIIRLDKLEEKSRSVLLIRGYEVPVGRSFWEDVDNIQF